MLITRRPAKCIFRGNPLKKALLLAGLATALAAAGGPALAADGTWITTGANGTWNTAANWQSGTIPGTTTGTTSTDTAWFSALLTAARTVTVDANRNIRNITFDDGNSGTWGYDLSGGSLLLTSGGTILATGSLGAHTDTISAPMTILGNNATYTIANNSTLATRRLSISGNITGQSVAGGTTTLTLTGNNTGTNQISLGLSNGTNGGVLALVKDGDTTWRFTGSAQGNQTTWSGPITINRGSLLLPNFNQAAQYLNANSITLANTAGAQLDFGTLSLNGSAIGFGSLSGGGANGGNIVNAGYANQGIFIGFDNTSTTYGGRFIAGTAGGGITKVGTGTLTLTGSGNDAGGATVLRGGGLQLDFSQAWTGTNILASTRALTFAGGRLLLTGSSGASNSQTFASTTVALGNSGIALTSNGASGLLASLGGITRNTGGTLDVTLPSNTQSATNGVRTTSTTSINGVTTNSSVAYLTVGGTTWGVTSGTNVAGLSSYATGAVNYTATNNVDVTNGDTIATGTVNTLRFNGSNTLNLTGTTTIGAGGVLVTPAATAGAAFSGGTLRPGGGNELVLINNGSLLTVDSVIANNGSTAAAVTLSGTGGFRLNGNNTYTGATTISSGSVTLGSATALGASGSSWVWIGDNPNAVLDLNGNNISIGSLAGGISGAYTYATAGGRVLLGSNTLTVGANNTATTVGSRISGSGTLVKVGTSSLELAGDNSAFTGGIVVRSGTLIVGFPRGNNPLGSATVTLGDTSGSANATLSLNRSVSGANVVLAPGGTGVLTIRSGTWQNGAGDPTFNGIVSGTNDVVIDAAGNNASFLVSGTVDNAGKVRFTNNTQSRLSVSSVIGSNVTDLTIENNINANGNGTFFSTFSGGLNNTGRLVFSGSGVAATNTTVSGTISNASGLTVNTSGYYINLHAANTFTGDTLIQAGTLRLGNNLALQNSGLDTSGAGVLTLSSVTTLTLGGLIGSKDAASVITTGYASVTALTLNPQSGKSYTYSGNIGNGAANMTLTKSGSGTQVLSGSNSYSGATTISTGMLQFGKAASLYGGTTANWTATNIRTGSGATLAFNVGGTDEFTTGNVNTLLTNLASSTSATNGMRAGSFLGFDTTNASGGTFTIADVIANTTGTSGGARGLRKLGTNTLLLSASNSFTGATSVEAGTLAFDRVTALNSSSGIGINAGTILDYTGTTAGTLSRNVTVATSGTGTIRNSGGQKLTLSGTLTKDGRVLRLTGGTFDVSGQIVGSSSNSDLIVDGTSTVTLLTANTYNGPTFVNQSSNLIVGINNAIPNNSIVTLGNATTTGTLSLGSFSNAIGGLVFSGSGGTVRMAANQTASPQLSTASSLSLGSNASLDLAGMATGSGAYKLISYTSRTGTFATVAGLDPNYLLRYDTVTANEITAQRKADQATTFTMTTGGVTRALINTNVTVSGTVTNSTPSGGSSLVLGLASTGLTGSGFTTGTITPGSNLAVSGLLNAGSNVGVQNWSITNTDGNAITTVSTATGSLTVVNQRTFSVSNSGTINLGNFLRGTAVTGSTTISSSGLNATTANASLGNFSGGPSGFSLALDTGTNVFNGGSALQQAVYSLSGSAASAGAINGSFTSTVTAEFGSIDPVSVALVGTAYDPATASFNALSTLTSGTVDIGSFNQNTGLHTAGFDIFNLFSGDLAFAADLMLDSITPIGTPFSSLSTNLSGTAFGSLAAGQSNSWTATLNSSTVGSFMNQYQLNFVSAKNVQSLGGPQSMTLTVTGVIIVPEPGALALAGIGIAAAAYALRRRR